MRYHFNGKPQSDYNNDYGAGHPGDSNGMYSQLPWNEQGFDTQENASSSGMVVSSPVSYNNQVFDKNQAIVNNSNAMQQHQYTRPNESNFPAYQVDSQSQMDWTKMPETSSYDAQQGPYPNPDAIDALSYPGRQQMAYMQHPYDSSAFYSRDMPGQMGHSANFEGFTNDDQQGDYQNFQNEYPAMSYSDEMQMPAGNAMHDTRYMPAQVYDNQQQPFGQYNDFLPQQDGNTYHGLDGYQTPLEQANTPFQQFSQQQQNMGTWSMQNTPANHPQQQMKQGGMMSYFQDDKGQLDVDKMLSTVGHAANTFQQITPVMKGLGSIFSAFRK